MVILMSNLGIDASKYADYFEKNNNKLDIFSANIGKEAINKTESFENSFSLWIGYYKQFPHVFVEEYLGVKLKDFQILILYQMMHGNYTMFLASRGLGKTFLTAIFVLTMCILYPETKIVVAGGSFIIINIYY